MHTGNQRFTPIEPQTFLNAPSQEKGYPSTVVKLLELLSDLRSEFDKLEVGQPVQLTHDCYSWNYSLPKWNKRNGCEVHKLYQVLKGKHAPDEMYTLKWRHPRGRGLPLPSKSLVYITKELRKPKPVDDYYSSQMTKPSDESYESTGIDYGDKIMDGDDS
tara:strand:+ start:316 stop:795 length:480 start_codon:yes stop_codon:yes gene_type:complete